MWRSEPLALARWSVTVALAIAVRADPSAAQASAGFQARVDNDGFDFWKRPAQRSDGEYTNGVRLALELGRAPLWLRLTRARPCADVHEGVPRCSSLLASVGQHIYTPPEDSQPYTYDGWRRQRPYAGWLYGDVTMRTVRRSTVREVGLTLGVTGPPSMADQAQRKAHELMRRYTTVPVGWETQLRFEPGVIAHARQRWMLFSGRIGGVRLLDAVVGTGASVGNIVTNVEATGDLRFGVNLSHPWRRARHRGLAELVGTIGVRGQGVARNIFLDGNTIDPDRRVARRHFVGDVRGSLGLRVGPVVVAYAVTERSREYQTGPKSHTYGSLVFGIGGTPDPTP